MEIKKNHGSCGPQLAGPGITGWQPKFGMGETSGSARRYLPGHSGCRWQGPVGEDGEQHEGAVGKPFGVVVGSAEAHRLLSMVAHAANGESSAAAHAGGRGGHCSGWRAERHWWEPHGGNGGVAPWPEMPGNGEPSLR
jgi:hypothetical protein